MVITRKLKYDTPRLSMGGVDIQMATEIKMLGVTIDAGLTFNSHVANVCSKAIAVYKRLVRAAKIDWGLNPEVLRTIYVAVIEPIVLYAASAWAPAAAKAGVKKRLSIVQRGIAQKVCKAYRTVSLNSALLLAGILPLDLRVREMASLYEARRGAPIPGLGDREIERRASALKAPHPAERFYVDFTCLVDRAELDNREPEVQIYTDGSKIGGRVGAAISIWRSGAETKAVKLALSSYCSVYQAELLAIYRATKLATKMPATSFGVYSDSMAALQSLQNPHCLHPLAVETRKHLKSMFCQGKDVTLSWVKAHAGLEGNERADVLAKEAAVGSKRTPDYDRVPVSHIKRCLREATIDEWNTRYTSGETASVTKLFFPDARVAYRAIKRIRPSGPRTQAMTGHGGFSAYLARFKCKESPSCVCDPAAEETAVHIICECPVNDHARFNLENAISMKVEPSTIKSIMTSKYYDTFLKYCEKVVKTANKRNK